MAGKCEMFLQIISVFNGKNNQLWGFLIWEGAENNNKENTIFGWCDFYCSFGLDFEDIRTVITS